VTAPTLSELRARTSQALEDSPLWVVRGMELPRGCVLSSQLTPEEVVSYAGRVDARGTCRAATPSPDLSRRLLSELCAWCASHSLNAMGTVTFSDSYASSRSIYTLSRALSDVAHALDCEVPLRKSHGVLTSYALSAEWHRTGREVPHVHVAIKTTGNPDSFLAALRLFFSNTRGRCRWELMRDCDDATLYGLKDVLKEGSGSLSDSVRLRLHSAVNRRRRRVVSAPEAPTCPSWGQAETGTRKG